MQVYLFAFFFSSRRRHTRWPRDWSSDVCSSDLNHLGVSAKRNRSDHRAGLVGRDSDVDALEFLEVEVAGRGQGPTQGADEVEFADRGASGTEEHLLEAADGDQLHSVTRGSCGWWASA